MTRARNDLLLLVPLKFYLTNQPKNAAAHVYGGRSRFMTEKVLKCFDALGFQGAGLTEGSLAEGGAAALDVQARLKEMW
jgi:DNA helicase-2/ATP-dependent DNA helicase PcrA